MLCALIVCGVGLAGAAQPESSFVFGTASSAWQFEGATEADGRGETIWDAFCRTPGKCFNNRSADVAVDQYNLSRFEGDIRRMQALGTTAYRLSLAWSRILPKGTGAIEPRGISHYQSVLAMLKAAGIDPWVTLFHFDLPEELELAGGWLNRSIVDHFKIYAKICFDAFGDQVQHWFTINEPHTVATSGYLYGVAAPGRCSDRSICSAGDGSVEPYIAGHNMLLAHARAVDVFRAGHRGTIDMVLSADWTEPLEDVVADHLAAERRQQFQVGWFAEPIWRGDYPKVMRELVGDRLPRFSTDERLALQGSYSLFAVNHYTSRFARALPLPASPPLDWDTDQCVDDTPLRNGTPIGPTAGSDWLYAVPWGLGKLLRWIAARYDAPIYVTENGCDDTTPGLNDTFRVDYFHGYLTSVRDAMLDGVDVRGYFAWSLLDNFEWSDGQSKRFGFYHVAYEDDLKRFPKASAAWFASLSKSWPQIPSCETGATTPTVI